MMAPVTSLIHLSFTGIKATDIIDVIFREGNKAGTLGLNKYTESWALKVVDLGLNMLVTMLSLVDHTWGNG